MLVVGPLLQVLHEWWAPPSGYCVGGGPPPSSIAWIVDPLPHVGLGIVWVVSPLPQ